MRLSPPEQDKLLLHQAGVVAQKRLARGLRLNHPEAVALIATQLLELIRDGRSVAEVMSAGQRVLGRRQVLPGVAELVPEVQVEGTFLDGSKLVTVHHPIASEHGDLKLALYGSGLAVPDVGVFGPHEEGDALLEGAAPGAVAVASGDVELNVGRATVTLAVTNRGDRPIQVGSHYHFTETNRALAFDRAAAAGFRLDIPAGTAVRFEPGETKTVALVEIAGARVVRGGNQLVDGRVTDPREVAQRAVAKGFAHTGGTP